MGRVGVAAVNGRRVMRLSFGVVRPLAFRPGDVKTDNKI